ncbi:hypothetical protein LJB90_02615 [Eubacteriales bacterium OttesenSCG-928-G02]|nr:hypothetical protein [Eubacteriales bacterium OttesenSCG-928-G02]
MLFKYKRCPYCGKNTKASIKSRVIGIYNHRCENCCKVYKIKYEDSILTSWILILGIIEIILIILSRYFSILMFIFLLVPSMIQKYCPKYKKTYGDVIQSPSGMDLLYENLMLTSFKVSIPNGLKLNRGEILPTIADFDSHDCFSVASPVMIAKTEKDFCYCAFLYEHPGNDKCFQDSFINMYKDNLEFTLKVLLD